MRSAVAFAIAAGKLVAAHATFQSIIIDGKDQGHHVGVQTPSNGNNPIEDVTSTAMICNGGTEKDVKYVEVAAGSEIGLQWHHNDGVDATGDTDEPIAASHKGPTLVYLAEAETKGEGESWVKIFEEGYNSGTWGVDTFISNKGVITATIPASLKPGNYYIRPELLALHSASPSGGFQFYNGCGQIKVTGSGSTAISGGVDLTKAYSASEAGVVCNIYSGDIACTADGSAGYDIPGPAVWDAASSGGSSPAPVESASPAEPSAPAESSAAAEAPSSTEAATPTETTPAAIPTGNAPAPTITSSYEVSKPSATSAAAQPTATSEAEAPSTGGDSGLPETFTIAEFITWLESKAGSSDVAKRFAQVFARRAHARDFA